MMNSETHDADENQPNRNDDTLEETLPKAIASEDEGQVGQVGIKTIEEIKDLVSAT